MSTNANRKAKIAAETRRAQLRAKVKADLMAGVEGRPLYDAWAGKGRWIPVVKLYERDAGIVADYVAGLMESGATS